MRTPNAKRLRAGQDSPARLLGGVGARRLRTAGPRELRAGGTAGEQKREGPGAMENFYKPILQTSMAPLARGVAAVTGLLTIDYNAAPSHAVQSEAESPASSE